MKRIIIISLHVLFSFAIYSQSICCDDSLKYIAAYNYIKHDLSDKGAIILVADSIIDLDRSLFSEDVPNCLKNKLEQYWYDKKFIEDKPFYSPCIHSLFCKTNDFSHWNHVLFFSVIEDNMLRADVVRRKPKKYEGTRPFSYNWMAFQTIGYDYLFIFDEDRDTIKDAFSYEMIID